MHVHACMLSHFSCVQLFATLKSAHQAPMTMGFSRQEYWNGLPCPPPGDLPNPGTNFYLLCLLHWQAGSCIYIYTLGNTWKELEGDLETGRDGCPCELNREGGGELLLAFATRKFNI